MDDQQRQPWVFLVCVWLYAPGFVLCTQLMSTLLLHLYQWRSVGARTRSSTSCQKAVLYSRVGIILVADGLQRKLGTLLLHIQGVFTDNYLLQKQMLPRSTGAEPVLSVKNKEKHP